jgi:hypothetical protein
MSARTNLRVALSARTNLRVALSARTGLRVAHTLALALALLAASCSEAPAPEPEGVGPSSNAHTASTASRAPLELTRPAQEVRVEPATTASAPSETTRPPATIGPDIADLGPFDVISWDEAVSRAAQQIQASNAAAELVKLQAELESRP